MKNLTRAEAALAFAAPLKTPAFTTDVPASFAAAHGSEAFELEPAVASGARRGLVGVGGLLDAVHHAIAWSGRELGEQGVKQLLDGIETPNDVLMDRQPEAPDVR